ncbi:hypothetical protein FKM82_029882 [Ascaphus truei]
MKQGYWSLLPTCAGMFDHGQRRRIRARNGTGNENNYTSQSHNEPSSDKPQSEFQEYQQESPPPPKLNIPFGI